jgi:hypothetical protein
MRRSEAAVVLGFALVLVVSGVTFLVGPWGLVVSGVVLLAAVLFMPVKEN